MFILVMEQTNACKAHGHAIFVACLNHLVISDRTTRLRNVFDTALMRSLDVITEWEESV